MPCHADPSKLLPPANDCIAPLHQFPGIYHSGNVAAMSTLQIPRVVFQTVLFFPAVIVLAGVLTWEWMLSAISTGHGYGNLPPCTDVQFDPYPPHAGFFHDVSHAFGRPFHWFHLLFSFPVPPGSGPSTVLNLLAVPPQKWTAA